MQYLLIDIGNSRIKIAVVDNGERRAKIVMSTGLAIEEPLDEFILQYIVSNGIAIGAIRTALVSSVVPEYNDTISMACSRLGIQTLFITRDIPLPLPCAFPIKPMVGVDRLLLGYGASIRYPNQPVIVVSFGTATTFNCIDNGTFLGGVIFCGVMQSLQSLLQSASQLRSIPVEIRAKAPHQETIIAQTSQASIEYGFTQGFASMTEGMLAKLSAQFSQKPIYIAAGGLSTIIASYTDCFSLVEEDFVLESMRYLLQHESLSL